MPDGHFFFLINLKQIQSSESEKKKKAVIDKLDSLSFNFTLAIKLAPNLERRRLEQGFGLGLP